MIKLLRQMISSEKGQALPIVLALLVLGGLTIAPSLSYVTTSINSCRMIEEGMKGAYAADAGVEDVLWSLENGVPPSTQLLESINQMEVTIQTEEKGIYTLYLGELIQPGEHNDYLDVYGELVWDDEAGAYKYTITITWQPGSGDPVIHLEAIGARLPIGYSYQSGSAALFVENLSTDEPDETLDALEAYLLNWDLGEPKPSVSKNDPVKTQTFYITGEGGLEGYYAWVVANREDIGEVSSITGEVCRITATAKHSGDGETTARIVATIIISDNTTYILSWQTAN